MFPLKLPFITPNTEGGTVTLRREHILKAPPVDLKEAISLLLALFGIIVLSGVCYLTVCQAHPIFAYDGESLALRKSFDLASPAELEQQEYERWIAHTDLKYKNLLVQHPAKGIIHVKTTKWINSRPIKVNIVEINPKANSKLEIKPKTASQNYLNKKATIRNIVKGENSIVAINGGYFKPQTGVPLGTLVIDKKVLTGPIYDRVALGINSNGTFSMDRGTIDITIKGRTTEIKADNINQPRMLSTYTLVYTSKWGQYAPPAPKYGMSVAIKNNHVYGYSYGQMEIPEGGYVIVGPKQKLEALTKDRNINLSIKFPESFTESEHIIGGGPYLVKNGQMYVDIKEQRFGAINGKNPRTAVGYTKNNELIIVTVDGREETSVGMTLWEISKLMKDLGCEFAMNLDGGGSSVIYVKGKIQNAPAYAEGIAISNALVVNELEPVQTAVATIQNKFN